MKMMKLCLVVAFVAILSGCAGKEFVRSDNSSLQLGKTTIDEIRSNFGKPDYESTDTLNDQEITNLMYASSGGAFSTKIQYSRALSLFFWKGMLVSHVFNSSYEEDTSIFDASKRTQIVKGKTTRDEVIKLLGKPSGYGIYPYIKDKTGHVLVFAYYTRLHLRIPGTSCLDT